MSSAKWRPFCVGLNELNKNTLDLSFCWIIIKQLWIWILYQSVSPSKLISQKPEGTINFFDKSFKVVMGSIVV